MQKSWSAVSQADRNPAPHGSEVLGPIGAGAQISRAQRLKDPGQGSIAQPLETVDSVLAFSATTMFLRASFLFGPLTFKDARTHTHTHTHMHTRVRC